jgi:hypothetical protein
MSMLILSDPKEEENIHIREKNKIKRCHFSIKIEALLIFVTILRK